MTELVPVRVRDCACPDTPHDDGDVVFLLPMLGLDGGILAEQQMLAAAAAGDSPGLTRSWLRTFVEHGAVGWNFLDEQGESVPFDLEVLLADWRLSRPVADKAADLYTDVVMAPFQQASPKSSRTGQTRRGTSRTREPISESPA